jgi:Na+/melibiose symporter-like transporter
LDQRVSTIALLAVSVALMTTFILVQLRHDHPLVRLGILRNPALVHANLAAFAMFGSYAAFQFIATLYVQDSLGWSPITMALAFLPTGIIVVLGAPRIGPVIQRLGTSTTILFGMLAFAAGYALFLRVSPSMPYVEFLLPTMLLIGVGFGLSFAALNAQATAGVANHEQGLASGLLNTSLQIGGAIVLAVVTAILGTGGHPGPRSAPPAHENRHRRGGRRVSRRRRSHAHLPLPLPPLSGRGARGTRADPRSHRRLIQPQRNPTSPDGPAARARFGPRPMHTNW